jgi:hypothetical protein
MSRAIRNVLLVLCGLVPVLGFAQNAPPQGSYKNFHVAIYVVVNATEALSDKATFEREYARVASQVKFDRVYIEVYRSHNFATDAQIEAVKGFFRAKGVAVSGGVTLAAGGQGGQFGTFDYEKPEDRAECKKAAELAARHFDNVIMDDFFFYTSKSDADIKAKGKRSWTQYRLDTMRAVSQALVLGPAKAVNPRVRMVIKYPNWYEHFQGLGYDLEKESRMFSGIYTGTETRDPEITDQLLQQYESYEIIRYYDNIRPGGNGGGWVDTYSTRYADRYAEQLWDTLFAKAPEITLFNWSDLADPHAVPPGERPWKDEKTSFDWNGAMVADSGWGRIAGAAFERIDPALGLLGNPVGIASYKPYQSSSGEDFLQNYLGTIGLPVEMTPNYPVDAQTVLLTENAKFDPKIVARIEASLRAGHNVVITSGLLRALQGKGIEDVVEWGVTGRVAAVHDFLDGYGAGNGASLNDPAHDNPAILFPEIHFYTNDSWPIVRGVAGAKGFPILLMNRYSNGIIYVLAVPENIGDLYSLPTGVLTRIKAYFQEGTPVRLDAPARVSLFTYDNGTLVVESFRDTDTPVTISLDGEGRALSDAMTGDAIAVALPPTAEMLRHHYQPPQRTDFAATIPPHSWRVFRVAK